MNFNRYYFKSLVLILFLCLYSCKKNEDKALLPLFSKLDSLQTNIDFRNDIVDTKKENILIYESFYNGGGVALGDINNDGLLDVYFSGNQVNDKLYLNKGNFVFEDITTKAGILKKGGWSSGVTFADVNGDGFLDIYVCKTLYDNSPQLRKNELYINKKNGTFKEVASNWGVDNVWRSQQATFLDYDNDGDVDLFLVNQPPNPAFLSPLSGQDWLNPLFGCRLFKNNGTKFIDVTKESGIFQRGYGLHASASDFNKDGLIDVYVSNDYDSPDFLYQNNGDGTFTNIINTSMKHISYFSMGTDVGDINNDGWSDLISLDMVAEDNFRLKSNMSGMNPQKFWNIVNAGGNYQYMFNTLQLNNGVNKDKKVSFSEIAHFSGIARTDWSWSPLIADFDNDGFKDLFVSNGIKKDLRNNDAKKKTEIYIDSISNVYVKENPKAGNVSIWDIIDYKKIIGLLPSQKLQNYIFRNNGDYKFIQKQKEWGLEEAGFSSGAAYGDLDNDGDLDLIVNNVDQIASVYRNNSKQNFLRIVLKEDGLAKSFFGVKVKISYDSKFQYYETTNSQGFYSCSENNVHFGVGKAKQIDEIIVDWGNNLKSVVNNVKSNQVLTIDKSKVTKGTIESSLIKEKILFTDITKTLKLDYEHIENFYDDYVRESLLPHKMSTTGPTIASEDINKDGLLDLFIGGAKNQTAKLFIQNKEGSFSEQKIIAFEKDKGHEDTGACFFDADNDGDIDLYVASGGNENPVDSKFYEDRLYLNNGNGNLKRSSGKIPPITESGSKVRAVDFDNDGDLDLFVGGRQIPGKYPFAASSYLLENNKGIFKDITKTVFPNLKEIGMVTDALWTDFDKDGDKDLFIVGEWMSLQLFENKNGVFEKIENQVLENAKGWWNSIEEGDFDNDGDMDYIVGNLGLNYKFKASKEEPFEVHTSDFDNNGTLDIVLSYYENGVVFPVRGRECTSQQIPSIKTKFTNYNKFASSNLIEVYSKSALSNALSYKATTFASMYIENKGNNQFVLTELPTEAQFSSVNDIIVYDFTKDGNLDIVIAGNLYNSEVETTRNDAGISLLLKGDGKGNFKKVPQSKSGLFAPNNTKELMFLKNRKQGSLLIYANNNEGLKVFEVH